jgi:hypothetical protein
MKRFDLRWATLITFVVLLLGWWYWYEYRPQKIREECAQIVIRGVMSSTGNVADVERSGRVIQNICEDAGGADASTEAALEGRAQKK